MSVFPFGPFALKRIDKTIQDPVWDSAKTELQKTEPSKSDPTGQWSNQPHIEFWTSEFYFGAPHSLQESKLIVHNEIINKSKIESNLLKID